MAADDITVRIDVDTLPAGEAFARKVIELTNKFEWMRGQLARRKRQLHARERAIERRGWHKRQYPEA